jgi:hypothetical protein
MRKNYSYLILTIIPILAIGLPISFENNYEASGIIYPIRELTVLDIGGSYKIEYIDRLNPQENFSYQQEPERGDIQSTVYFGHSEGSNVSVGDTLLQFTSSLKSERISQLKGQLEVEKANLTVLSTGEKPETIERVLQEYTLAEKRHKIAVANHERVVPLAKKGFLSQLELAQYERQLRDTEGALEIVRRRMDETATGQKGELVNLSLSNINRIQMELETLETTISRLSIISPVDGRFKQSQYQGYVAGVEDCDTLVYVFPVTQDKLAEIGLGDRISLKPFGIEEELKAEIVQIGRQAKLIENIPSVMVTSVLIGDHDLPAGSLAKATVRLGDLDFLDYITSNSRR